MYQNADPELVEILEKKAIETIRIYKQMKCVILDAEDDEILKLAIMAGMRDAIVEINNCT